MVGDGDDFSADVGCLVLVYSVSYTIPGGVAAADLPHCSTFAIASMKVSTIVFYFFRGVTFFYSRE